MAFNEKLPKWDNVGVEPPESKKTEGWQPTEKPPAQWFNWIFNRIYKVVDEIRSKAVEKQDIASQEIDKGASLIGINDADNKFTATNVEGALKELFTNVSDGKQVVATAITGKGVPTSGSDTFSKMATNINAIATDKTGDATALANDILAPKTAYSKGVKLVGTIPSKGVATITPGITPILIEAGQYLSGRQTIAGVTVPVANVLVGTTIAGQAGTMPNIGKQTGTVTNNNGQIAINKGYHDGTGFIKALLANLLPENIKYPINVGGVVGSYKPDHTVTLNISEQITKDLPFLGADAVFAKGNYNLIHWVGGSGGEIYQTSTGDKGYIGDSATYASLLRTPDTMSVTRIYTNK